MVLSNRLGWNFSKEIVRLIPARELSNTVFIYCKTFANVKTGAANKARC